MPHPWLLVIEHQLKRGKQRKTEEATKSPSGTYYLDEIFKTTVSMEIHQKHKPHSSTLYTRNL